MKLRVNSILLLLAVFICLFLISIGHVKGTHFMEMAGGGEWLFTVGVSLMLPFWGFFTSKEQRSDNPRRAFLGSNFLISLVPTVILVWLFLNACFVRYEGHIFERDSAKVVIGMSREQVIQAIGNFDRATSPADRSWETFGYYVQRPWGFDRKKFHVRFRNGKVVSAEFRTGIQADDLTQ